MAGGMVDPAIFEDLQRRADEDSAFREDLKTLVQALEKDIRNVQSTLSKAHSTPVINVDEVTDAATLGITTATTSLSGIAEQASKQPYYRYNGIWTRQVQELIFVVLFCEWLRGAKQSSQLLPTIEEVGGILRVPVNLKDRDAFHITIEEYLQALISLLEELARLARNSVVLGDYRRPLQISQFIKDVHAGFQILNLKNDSLRRRSDGIKYRIKEVEDVVYDLSLRDLIPKDEPDQMSN